MSQSLVDTQVKLARCQRCQAYVWLGMSSGSRTAADVGAATHPAWIAAVAGGRGTYRLTKRAGKPYKLLRAPLGGKPPSFTPEGAQDVTGGRDEVVVEHGCGAAARDMLTFTELEQPPTPSVCDTWKASGWVPPRGRCARDRGQDVKSCPECDAPPFLAPEASQHGTNRGTENRTVEVLRLPEPPGGPGVADTPSVAPDLNHQPRKDPSWPSPTASAARPGPATDAHTAPAATKPSTATEAPTGTASAPTVSTATAPTPPPSASYAGRTASGTRVSPGHSYSAAEQPVRCDICNNLIDQSKPFTGIHHIRWVWAVHETDGCP